MSGKIIYTPPPRHTCEGIPDLNDHLIGTQWQCDDCNQVYELSVHILRGLYWAYAS